MWCPACSAVLHMFGAKNSLRIFLHKEVLEPSQAQNHNLEYEICFKKEEQIQCVWRGFKEYSQSFFLWSLKQLSQHAPGCRETPWPVHHTHICGCCCVGGGVHRQPLLFVLCGAFHPRLFSIRVPPLLVLHTAGSRAAPVTWCTVEKLGVKWRREPGRAEKCS